MNLSSVNTWTPADYEKLETLFREGKTNGQLANALGRSERAVNKMLSTMGLNRGVTNCLHCGKELPPKPNGGRPSMYCRKSHGDAYRARPGNTPEKRAAVVVGAKPVQVICKGCGKQMTEAEVARRAAKRLPIDFCGGTCAKKK